MKIRKSLLIYAFVILIMMGPGRLMNMFLPYSSYVFMILQFCIGFLFLRNYSYGSMKKERETLLFILFFFIALLGMLFTYGTDVKGIIRYICWTCSLIGLHAFLVNADDDRIKVFLEAGRALYVVGYLLTILFGLRMTEDMAYGTAVFFWGSEAITVQAFITLFAISVYYDIRFYNQISKFAIIMGSLSVLFCIMNNSGQGISMFCTLIGLLLINKYCHERLWKIITPLVVLCVLAGLYYLVITLRFTEIDVVVNYITTVLSKDITLTGRDAIFSASLKIFGDHPWIGYGYNNAIINDVLGKNVMQFNTAHNSILQMLIDYGILGTGIFVLLMYGWMTKMYKTNDMASKVMYFSIIAMFIGGLVNMVVPTNNFWLVAMIGISMSYHQGDSDNIEE